MGAKPHRHTAAVLIVCVLSTGLLPAQSAPEAETPGDLVADLLPLGLEIEGRPVTDATTVLFYGPRVPRTHLHGGRRVTEPEFFTIADDPESARRAAVHRGINIGLGALSILSFFGGLVLFGAADQVDFGLLGLPPATQGRILSIGLLGGSIVPSVAVMVRGQHWASLEYAYQSMRDHNDAIGGVPEDENAGR